MLVTPIRKSFAQGQTASHMEPIYLALLLYVAAVVLAFVDLLVPSGGILLVLSASAALASILFGFRSSTTMGMLMLTVVAASIPIFAYSAIKIWPHTPIGKRVILGLPERKTKTESEPDPLEDLVGRVFISSYPLMPSGELLIGHQRYKAVAESGYIEAGQTVEIIGVRERNLVVRATTKELTPEAESPAAEGPREPENLLDLPADQLGIDSLEQ